MAPSSRTTQYPWGTVTPRERLRTLSERLRTAMAATHECGFTAVPDRVKGVVHASRPLVDAMEHLGRAGLRPPARGGASSDLPLACDVVLCAVESVNECLAGLVSSTIHDASERYRAFAEACEALLELADRAIRFGIAGGASAVSGDPWKAFDF